MRVVLEDDFLKLQSDDDEECVRCLNNDIDNNVNNCEIITFNCRKTVISSSYKLGEFVLKSDQVHDLGVLLDSSSLAFQSHIEYVCSNTTQILWFIRR